MQTTVQKFYDKYADTYQENRNLYDMSKIIDYFSGYLDTQKGELLDLGCGTGEPFARWFIDYGWSVTGVDFSKQMLELASKNVPKMKTICVDMLQVEFDSNHFDAITATYSLFHVPSKDHMALFDKFYRWLHPKGSALFTYATKEYTGSKDFSGYKEFMGEKLYYSHKSPEELYAMLEKTGFRIEFRDYLDIGGETFLWVIVSKPDSVFHYDK